MGSSLGHTGSICELEPQPTGGEAGWELSRLHKEASGFGLGSPAFPEQQSVPSPMGARSHLPGQTGVLRVGQFNAGSSSQK